jgi:hypothetical protein
MLIANVDTTNLHHVTILRVPSLMYFFVGFTYNVCQS